MEDDAAGVKSVSSEFRERDEKCPRTHIRPLQRYIEEEWVPLKPRQFTVEEKTLEKTISIGTFGSTKQ